MYAKTIFQIDFAMVEPKLLDHPVLLDALKNSKRVVGAVITLEGVPGAVGLKLLVNAIKHDTAVVKVDLGLDELPEDISDKAVTTPAIPALVGSTLYFVGLVDAPKLFGASQANAIVQAMKKTVADHITRIRERHSLDAMAARDDEPEAIAEVEDDGGL